MTECDKRYPYGHRDLEARRHLLQPGYHRDRAGNLVVIGRPHLHVDSFLTYFVMQCNKLYNSIISYIPSSLANSSFNKCQWKNRCDKGRMQEVSDRIIKIKEKKKGKLSEHFYQFFWMPLALAFIMLRKCWNCILDTSPSVLSFMLLLILSVREVLLLCLLFSAYLRCSNILRFAGLPKKAARFLSFAGSYFGILEWLIHKSNYFLGEIY